MVKGSVNLVLGPMQFKLLQILIYLFSGHWPIALYARPASTGLEADFFTCLLTQWWKIKLFQGSAKKEKVLEEPEVHK